LKEINLEYLIKILSEITPKNEQVELAVDLHDIYESSIKLDRLLSEINKGQQKKDVLLDKLLEIEIELDHISWHNKSFKKQLKALKKFY
jgi:hypothetical protein